MSLRLCSRAPETTIWLPAGICRSFYDVEQTFVSPRARKSAGCGPLGLYRGVHLVDQLAPVGELEVLREVALGVLARLAVERHVQRDQARTVEVAALRRGRCARLR